MADQKVTDLTALTSFSGDETFYVVEDDDGTPVSRKMTIEDLAAGLVARAEFVAAFASVKVGAGAGMSLNADDSVAISTTTAAVAFDVEDWDDAGFITLGTDATKITIPAGYAGRYEIGVEVFAPVIPVTDNMIGVRIDKNGSQLGSNAVINAAANSNTNSPVIRHATLAAGDYLQFKWINNSGASARNFRSGSRVWVRLDRPS